MKVVCDADALIKTGKAGFLKVLAEEVELLIGPQVYRESVIDGKNRGYADAYDLEQIVSTHVHVKDKVAKSRAQVEQLARQFAIGAGEGEVLDLYLEEAADVVLSDDRLFLGALDTLGIPYLTPAAALLWLVERKSLHREDALGSLEKLRPLIRSEHYRAALADIEGAGRVT
jgi:predicted nucleic acid-binding protein